MGSGAERGWKAKQEELCWLEPNKTQRRSNLQSRVCIHPSMKFWSKTVNPKQNKDTAHLIVIEAQVPSNRLQVLDPNL